MGSSPALRRHIAQVPTWLPQIALGIADNRLAESPGLVGWRINDRPAVLSRLRYDLVDIVDEDKRHRPQCPPRDRCLEPERWFEGETESDDGAPDRELCVTDSSVWQRHHQGLSRATHVYEPAHS